MTNHRERRIIIVGSSARSGRTSLEVIGRNLAEVSPLSLEELASNIKSVGVSAKEAGEILRKLALELRKFDKLQLTKSNKKKRFVPNENKYRNKYHMKSKW